MSIEEAAASPEHQRMVKGLIDKLKELGFKITHAAYENYQEPYKIGRHEPDIIAHKDDEELIAIGEAKRCEDLVEKRTEEQIKDFSNRVMSKGKSQGKSVPLHIVVPEQCKDDLYAKLKELGLHDKPNIKRWYWTP